MPELYFHDKRIRDLRSARGKIFMADRCVLISFHKLIHTFPSSYCNLRDNYERIYGAIRVAGTCRYSSFAVQTMPPTPISFVVPFDSVPFIPSFLEGPSLPRSVAAERWHIKFARNIVRPCEEDVISRLRREYTKERSSTVHWNLRWFIPINSTKLNTFLDIQK